MRELRGGMLIGKFHVFLGNVAIVSVLFANLKTSVAQLSLDSCH